MKSSESARLIVSKEQRAKRRDCPFALCPYPIEEVVNVWTNGEVLE